MVGNIHFTPQFFLALGDVCHILDMGMCIFKTSITRLPCDKFWVEPNIKAQNNSIQANSVDVILKFHVTETSVIAFIPNEYSQSSGTEIAKYVLTSAIFFFVGDGMIDVKRFDEVIYTLCNGRYTFWLFHLKLMTGSS